MRHGLRVCLGTGELEPHRVRIDLAIDARTGAIEVAAGHRQRSRFEPHCHPARAQVRQLDASRQRAGAQRLAVPAQLPALEVGNHAEAGAPAPAAREFAARARRACGARIEPRQRAGAQREAQPVAGRAEAAARLGAQLAERDCERHLRDPLARHLAAPVELQRFAVELAALDRQPGLQLRRGPGDTLRGPAAGEPSVRVRDPRLGQVGADARRRRAEGRAQRERGRGVELAELALEVDLPRRGERRAAARRHAARRRVEPRALDAQLGRVDTREHAGRDTAAGRVGELEIEGAAVHLHRTGQSRLREGAGKLRQVDVAQRELRDDLRQRAPEQAQLLLQVDARRPAHGAAAGRRDPQAGEREPRRRRREPGLDRRKRQRAPVDRAGQCIAQREAAFDLRVADADARRAAETGARRIGESELRRLDRVERQLDRRETLRQPCGERPHARVQADPHRGGGLRVGGAGWRQRLRGHREVVERAVGEHAHLRERPPSFDARSQPPGEFQRERRAGADPAFEPGLAPLRRVGRQPVDPVGAARISTGEGQSLQLDGHLRRLHEPQLPHAQRLHGHLQRQRERRRQRRCRRLAEQANRCAGNLDAREVQAAAQQGRRPPRDRDPRSSISRSASRHASRSTRTPSSSVPRAVPACSAPLLAATARASAQFTNEAVWPAHHSNAAARSSMADSSAPTRRASGRDGFGAGSAIRTRTPPRGAVASGAPPAHRRGRG
ncbi:MAG: hypothetical protein M5U30_16815 [Burkholderiaceae bacterium]|nr:hypothetical protein [Burkholderiaceae bacterium]